MHALQICSEIQKHFMPDIPMSLVAVVPNVGDVIFGGNQARMLMRMQAWNSLFHGMQDEEAIKHINEIWLDPDYILLTEKSARESWDN